MTTQEQAMEILQKIKSNRPIKFFDNISESEAGMRFVLVYLIEHNQDVYSSVIAEEMKISRARMAVLIQKLENKGYIEKYQSPKDKRIDVIKITQKGIERSNILRNNVINSVIKIIDEVGMEDINKFIQISAKIKKILQEM